MSGTYADIKWEERFTHSVKRGSPITSLFESADDLTLTCMLGVVHYSRERDSEALAQALESAASIVREYS
jgi:hypothetical protein